MRSRPPRGLPSGRLTTGGAAWAVALLAAILITSSPAGAPAFPVAATAMATPIPSEPSLEPGSQTVLDQIASCVDHGTFSLEIDLRDGLVPVADVWKVEVVGTPTATLAATAVGGHVHRLDVALDGGTLLLRGNRLRPKILIESLRFELGKGITAARYRGRGIWRPIVWAFRSLARSAMRKLEFRTDVPSVMHGDVLIARGAAAPTAPGEARARPPSSLPSSPRGPSFLDLVEEVRIRDSQFVAFGGRPLNFGGVVEFHTATRSRDGTPVRVAIVAGILRPAREGGPAQFAVAGRFDGEISNGAIAFVGSRCAFSHGDMTGGAFRIAKETGGATETTISATSLALELTAGEFHLPGGPRVDVEAPSRFVVRDLLVQPGGQYSGIVDAELSGRAGRIERGGAVVSLSDVTLRTSGAVIVDGRATGDVEIESSYRMDYPLVVRYPVTQVGERRVQLHFQGSLATRLRLENAGGGAEGGGEEGTVEGEYRFTVPWPPVEEAAFEVLRAAWSQDIPPIISDVGFVIEPRRFRPCGGNCFLVSVVVTVEKTQAEHRLFRQFCDAQGKADLVVDAATRSFVLRNVRIEPRCRGLVGWVVNFIGPFLTQTYTDLTVFQMPRDLPFTIASVDSGADSIAIAGRVAWTSNPPEVPPGTAQPPGDQSSAKTP